MGDVEETWETKKERVKKLGSMHLTHKKVKVPADLDAGIKRYVEVLIAAGVQTYESCEGGKGHSYKEPTICFHGERSEGFRALAVALQHNLPVYKLCRVWRIEDLEPVGPDWEIIFY